MKRFEFKGLTGLLLMTLIGLLTLVALVVGPAWLVMWLWNALIPVALLNGPTLTLFQGMLLWGVVLMLALLVFRPEIHIQMGDEGDIPDDPAWPPEPPTNPVDESQYSEHWRKWRQQHKIGSDK